ncbi:MAG: class I SAM-dependent methyltransferase [Verrucomicrobiota bacterium]
MIRKLAKTIVPAPIWNRLGGLRRSWVTRDDDKLTTREVFSRIYQKRIWTGDEELSSGAGSRFSDLVDPYIDCVTRWAEEHDGKHLTALDLGCGDFHVGRRVFPNFGKYIAADIVPILIDNHRKNHIAPNLEFLCVDGINEELPQADVIFIRQVLQHLSNEQILKILPKLGQFKHAIISEHIPSPAQLKARNLDKIHGGGIRLGQGSGIYLEDPPFNLKSRYSTVLLELPHGPDVDREGVIVTTHYRLQ